MEISTWNSRKDNSRFAGLSEGIMVRKIGEAEEAEEVFTGIITHEEHLQVSLPTLTNNTYNVNKARVKKRNRQSKHTIFQLTGKELKLWDIEEVHHASNCQLKDS